MLKKVIRPYRKHVDFTYDALGRRLTKTFKEETTHFVWDGNTPLHEWTSQLEETISIINDKGEKEINIPENLTTWIFEDGTFVPMAKLEGGKSYSIITDHLGTPTEAYDEEGKKVWSRQLGIYGQTRKETGTTNFIPFKYQGQYEDVETGLCYNRYRYYDSSAGIYISQDPIRLEGNNPNFYAYVKDVGNWVDPFGLDVASGSGRTHVKYSGVKNGQPYHGYASAPTADGLTSDQIVARRYGNNFDNFDVNPSVDYTGEGVEGKNTARGLEQRGFEADGGLKGTANAQNPVGENNPKRQKYLDAADAHNKPKKC